MMLRARFALRRLSKANLTEVTVKSPEVRISRPGAVVGAGLILCAGLLASCGTLKGKRRFDPTFRVEGGSVSLRSGLDRKA